MNRGRHQGACEGVERVDWGDETVDRYGKPKPCEKRAVVTYLSTWP